MDLRTAARCLAVVAAVTVTGCAAAPEGAAPSGGSRTEPARTVGFTDPVVEIRQVQADIGGVTAQRRAVLYDDGTVIRSGDPGGWVTATVTETEMQDLLDRAARDGLLDDDLDLGSAHVSDSPWTTLTFATTQGTVEHRVESSAPVDGLDGRQQTARAAFDTMVEELSGMDGTPYSPARALAWVEDGNLLDLPAPPSVWNGSTTLDQQTACVDLPGSDLELLHDLYDEQEFPDGLDRSVVVRGADSNTYRLRVRELLPHDPGCP